MQRLPRLIIRNSMTKMFFIHEITQLFTVIPGFEHVHRIGPLETLGPWYYLDENVTLEEFQRFLQYLDQQSTEGIHIIHVANPNRDHHPTVATGINDFELKRGKAKN